MIKQQHLKEKQHMQQEEKQGSEQERIIKQHEEKMQEYVNDAKRVRADFENYVKRVEREKERVAKGATYALLRKMLSVMDDFDRAMHAVKAEGVPESTRQGMEMIRENLWKLLEAEGVQPIEVMGKRYDTHLHEVVKHLKSEKEDGIIVEEVQRGYLVHGEVLRPAKVIVTKVEDHE